MRRMWKIMRRALLIAAAALLALLLLYRFVPPVSTLMLARWMTLQSAHRQWVPLEQIAPSLQRAVIVSEDAKFCAHHGVDWDSLYDVLNDRGGPQRGASTITMQLARNLFLWQGRSYLRKGLEIPLALLIELTWPKRRILEAYLNIAEWGDGVFGAEAAAQKNFRHAAKNLSPREAQLLAVSLPNPHKRRAARPGAGLRDLADDLAARINAEGANTSCLSR